MAARETGTTMKRFPAALQADLDVEAVKVAGEAIKGEPA